MLRHDPQNFASRVSLRQEHVDRGLVEKKNLQEHKEDAEH
jgi:hypothetical protein